MHLFRRKTKKRRDSEPIALTPPTISLDDTLSFLSQSSKKQQNNAARESLMDSILMDFDNLLIADQEPQKASSIQSTASNNGGNTYMSYQLAQNTRRRSLPPLSRDSSVSSSSEDVCESIRSLLNRSTVDDAKGIIRIIQRDAVSSSARGSSNQSSSTSSSIAPNDPVVSAKMRKNRRYRTDPSLFVDSASSSKDSGKSSPVSSDGSSADPQLKDSFAPFNSSNSRLSPAFTSFSPPRSHNTSDAYRNSYQPQLQYQAPRSERSHSVQLANDGKIHHSTSHERFSLYLDQSSTKGFPESSSWLNRQAQRASSQKIASGRQSSKLPTTASSSRRSMMPVQLADRSVADDSDSQSDSSDDDIPLGVKISASPVQVILPALQMPQINPTQFRGMSLEAQQAFWVQYYQSSVMSQQQMQIMVMQAAQAQEAERSRKSSKKAAKKSKEKDRDGNDLLNLK